MTYDKIEWYSGSDDFPKELSFKNGDILIGIFPAWIINNDLMSFLQIESSKDSIEQLRKKKLPELIFWQKNAIANFGTTT